MCNDHTDNPFAGLEDEAEWAGDAEPGRPTASSHTESIGNVTIPGFVERCPKCRGSGSWRPGYPCFKCNGTGKLAFKTSPEARQRSRTAGRKRKEKAAAETAAAFLTYLDTMPEVRDWLIPAIAANNSFAASLYQGGLKYGHLTEKQVAAVREKVAQLADGQHGVDEWAAANEAEFAWLESETANGNEFAASLRDYLGRTGRLSDGQLAAVQRNVAKAREYAPSDLDISSLKGFYSVPDGDSRLKICVRKPGKQSRFNGWTFVDDGAAYGSRQNYGKQAPEGTYSGKVQDALRAILADPMAAQVAYGKLTGVCGRCGRMLEDEQSVANGIGPICATKI